MAGEFVDQIFVIAKHGLLSLLSNAPDWVIQIASSLFNIAAVLGAFQTLFALISVMERKILATHPEPLRAKPGRLAFFSRWPMGSSR